MSSLARGRGLALVIAVAIILRLAAAAVSGRFTPPADPWQHGHESGAVAVALATGHGFSDPFGVPTGPTAVVSPAMPFVWSLLVRAFGPHEAGAWRGMVLLGIALSALVAWPLACLGRSVSSDLAGAVAALLWSVHPVAVVGASGWLGTGPLFALLVVLTVQALHAVVTAGGGPGRAPLAQETVTLGLLLGAGLWVEPLLAPPTGVLALVLALRGRRPAAVRVLAACALAAVLFAPWVLRSALVFGEPVLTRSCAGQELLVGATTDPGAQHPSVRVDPPRSPAALARLRELGEPAWSRECTAAAFAAIRQAPLRFAAGSALRYAEFWLGRPSWWLPAKGHPLVSGLASAARGALHLLPVLAAAAGFALAWRRRREACLLLGALLLAYPVTYAFTHVEARYRLPVEPLLLLLVGLGAEALAARRADVVHARSPGRHEPAGTHLTVRPDEVTTWPTC